MHWADTAIILSVRKYGENSAILRVLTKSHGVWGGVVRGSHSKATRGVIQPGNIINASWQARLPEQLGSFKAELLEAGAALIMQEAARLAALTSACAIVEAALPERHPYEKLYTLFHGFLDTLKGSDDWPEEYVRLELALLAESGFGLDLSRCAATGATEELIYVSPRSGRAVSRKAGEPYKEKLLRLPEFLLPPPPAGGRAGVGESRYRKPDRYGSHALIPRARELRKESSPAEHHLWYYLRGHRLEGYSFRRQHPLSSHYIADFVCPDKKLVIELDGGQHAEQMEYDARRTEFLEQEGYQVLRFWNNDVFGNIGGVLEKIVEALQSPSPCRGEGRGGGNTTTSSSQASPSLTLPPTGRGNGAEEILAGLRLTGYFLEHWLLEPHRRKLPAARARLIETVKTKETAL
ncbi:MAG: DNA repair protein RecO [Pseudomonadota bacterium]|nr:DNA repair protein RecO [Pseudomonadota bacterium]